MPPFKQYGLRDLFLLIILKTEEHHLKQFEMTSFPPKPTLNGSLAIKCTNGRHYATFTNIVCTKSAAPASRKIVK